MKFFEILKKCFHIRIIMAIISQISDIRFNSVRFFQTFVNIQNLYIETSKN